MQFSSTVISFVWLFVALHLLLVSSVKADDESITTLAPSSITHCSSTDNDHCCSDTRKANNTSGGLLIDEAQDKEKVSAAVRATTETVEDNNNITITNEDLFETSSFSSSSSSSCGAYLAESTIPNSGLGVFTARAISAGEMILNTGGEPVIQIEDLTMHTRRRLLHYQLPDSSEKGRWMLTALWLSSFAGMGSFEAMDVKSFVPGLASACNYHPGDGLVNMQRMPPTSINAASPLHRTRDPGAGASTTYHGLHFVARDDIQAGSELFEDYGESYFTMRKYKYVNQPLGRDYDHANQILMQLEEMIDSDFSSSLAINVWNMITTLPRPEARSVIKALPAELLDAVSILKGNGKSVDSLGIQYAKIYTTASAQMAQKAWEMLRNLVALDEPELVLKALPNTLSDAPHAIQLGTAKFSLVGHSDARSLDWLATNGRCIDNIKPGKSEIPQAGHGAFATRRIQKGQVVAPIPVAQGLRKHMELYNVANPNNPDGRFVLVGKQLIINYCFGHADSSLLLFPYGPVVNYLNHNSTSYNAELKWSDLPTHRSDLLEKSPNEITRIDELGLVLELVATRDIEAGEEVLIDYGSKWESAWNDHVAHWKPPTSKLAASYVQAATLNGRHEWLRTRAELVLRPYPDNVQTICFVAGLVNDNESQGMAGATTWVDIGERLLSHTKSAIPCQVWERVIGEGLKEEKHVTMQDLWAMDSSESDAKVTYNVKVYRKDSNFFMKGLPRRAIKFFDKQYTSDQFLTNGFRHEMHLPDHLVSAAWKDLKKGGE